jgi:hypothetical protein
MYITDMPSMLNLVPCTINGAALGCEEAQSRNRQYKRYTDTLKPMVETRPVAHDMHFCYCKFILQGLSRMAFACLGWILSLAHALAESRQGGGQNDFTACLQPRNCELVAASGLHSSMGARYVVLYSVFGAAQAVRGSGAAHGTLG